MDAKNWIMQKKIVVSLSHSLSTLTTITVTDALKDAPRLNYERTTSFFVRTELLSGNSGLLTTYLGFKGSPRSTRACSHTCNISSHSCNMQLCAAYNSM